MQDDATTTKETNKAALNAPWPCRLLADKAHADAFREVDAAILRMGEARRERSSVEAAERALTEAEAKEQAARRHMVRITEAEDDLRALTRDEVVAALVDRSAGYLSPSAAERHLDLVLRGDTVCCCEGDMALYRASALERLLDALRGWRDMPRERKSRTLAALRGLRAAQHDDPLNGAGLFYPTSVL